MPSFNVMAFLAPRKQAKADLLEQIAEQLHAGQAMDPDEILHGLEQCGGTEEQLQAEIDRLQRVADLRAAVARGPAARKRETVIDAEIGKAEAALEAAHRAVQAVRAKHEGEASEVRATITQADAAASLLMQPENLCTSDRQRWHAIEQALADAHQALRDAEEARKRAGERVQRCDEDYPDGADDVSKHRKTDAAGRYQNAKAARAQQLTETEAALVKATQALADAERDEREFRRGIVEGSKR